MRTRRAIFLFFLMSLSAYLTTLVPWYCSGINLLANPQTRFFSPLFLLDLALPPQLANALGLFLYGIIGSWGMFRLGRAFNLTHPICLFLAFLFVHANWFGLHYAEGHIPFGSFQLFPWVLLSFIQIHKKQYSLLLVVLLSLFLLDGGLYPFIFSFFLGFSAAFLLGVRGTQEKLRGLIKQPLWTAALGVTFALTTAPKWLPVLWEHGTREPDLAFVSLSLPILLRSFFFPFNQVGGASYPIGIHEVGNYIGIAAFFFLIGCFFQRKMSFRAHWKYLVLIGFWLFVATGWSPLINPWNALFQKIPFLNNAHIQSRVFIIFHVFFLILLGKALSTLQAGPRARTLILFLLLEAFIVRNYTVLPVALNSKTPLTTYRLIQSQTVTSTNSEHSRTLGHYLKENVSSQTCYDHLYLVHPAIPSNSPKYPGEASIADQPGQVTLTTYTPDERHQLNHCCGYSWCFLVHRNTNCLSPAGRSPS